jgi:type IV pilus assembly protein PilV
MKRLAQTGFSLIEVLVTMVLVAITLLGLMGIQARSLTYQVDSMNGRSASDLLAQFKERLAANHLTFVNGVATTLSVSIEPGGTAPVNPECDEGTCTETDDIAQRELALWYAEVQRRLPAPALFMRPLEAGAVTDGINITLGWLDSEDISEGSVTGCADIEAIADDNRYRCITMTIFPG